MTKPIIGVTQPMKTMACRSLIERLLATSCIAANRNPHSAERMKDTRTNKTNDLTLEDILNPKIVIDKEYN